MADSTPPTAPRTVTHERQPAPEPVSEVMTEAVVPVEESSLSAHVERALMTLTTKMQNCIERLEALELRIDELSESVVNAPSHSDVLEVRLHSAKLAAELARATVELRGEIGMASDEARRAARRAQTPDTGEVPVVAPVDVDLNQVKHSERSAEPRANWSQSA